MFQYLAGWLLRWWGGLKIGILSGATNIVWWRFRSWFLFWFQVWLEIHRGSYFLISVKSENDLRLLFHSPLALESLYQEVITTRSLYSTTPPFMFSTIWHYHRVLSPQFNYHEYLSLPTPTIQRLDPTPMPLSFTPPSARLLFSNAPSSIAGYQI
jgi:hypothetical protein